MEEYIDEALAVGYIHPSTFAAAAGLFFVEKKVDFSQAFINEIFKDLINHYVIADTVDIPIYAVNLNDHYCRVHAVLSWLLHFLYIKAEKCEFYRTSITFLGYVISHGVEMDSSKVQDVTNWALRAMVNTFWDLPTSVTGSYRIIVQWSSPSQTYSGATLRNYNELKPPNLYSRNSRPAS